MELRLHLIAAVLVGVLAGTAPVSASVLRDSGTVTASHEVLNRTPSVDSAACTSSQCGLVDQRSAAAALAMAVGARPTLPSYGPAMVPDSFRTSVAGASGGIPSTLAPRSGTDVEPVLFSVIAPAAVAHGQLCMEEGNLLGLDATCKRLPPSSISVSGYNCPKDAHDRFGMKIACRVGIDIPEPGTLVLLGIGFIGLAAARLRIRRNASAAPL